jgi:hypothetical protein
METCLSFAGGGEYVDKLTGAIRCILLKRSSTCRLAAFFAFSYPPEETALEAGNGMSPGISL